MTKLKHILLCVVFLVGGLYASDQTERRIVTHREPEYPDIAAKMELHGKVRLKVWIAADGSVRRMEYIGGHPLLAESALKAVKNWKYEAAAQESTQIVEVKF